MWGIVIKKYLEGMQGVIALGFGGWRVFGFDERIDWKD
jgi:hypothetical protein